MPAALRKLAAPAEPVRRLWLSDPGTRRNYLLLVWFAAALSLHLALSWPDRFMASAYAVIRMTGGGWVWALLWAASAVSLLVARTVGLRATTWALHTGGVLHMLWAAAVGIAAATTPDVAWTGCLLFGGLAILHHSTALEHRPQNGGALWPKRG